MTIDLWHYLFWIRKWPHIATHLVLIGATLFKKRRVQSFYIEWGWNEICQDSSSSKYASIDEPNVASHFQDGGYDVMSRRKLLPSGECTRSDRPLPTASALCCMCRSVRRLPASNSFHSFWSIVHSLFCVPFITTTHMLQSFCSYVHFWLSQ